MSANFKPNADRPGVAIELAVVRRGDKSPEPQEEAQLQTANNFALG